MMSLPTEYVEVAFLMILVTSLSDGSGNLNVVSGLGIRL